MPISLTIDLRTPNGGFFGTDDGGVPGGALVTLKYDRDVRDADGTVPAPAQGSVVVSGATDPVVSVPFANDDAAVSDDSQGFAIIIGARWRQGTQVVSWSKTVAIDSSYGSAVSLSDLADAQPVPPQQMTVSGVLAVANQAVSDAQAAETSAASSADSAAASAALVGAPAGSAIDAHLGGDSTAMLTSAGKVKNAVLLPQSGYHPLLNGFFVEGYGADPTGGTDSTAALQACIDAAKSWLNSTASPGMPAARVYAQGSYLVASPLTPRSRVTIVGANPDASRLMGTGAGLFVTPTGGTSSAPTTISAFGLENISAECSGGPAFDVAGGFYDGLSRPTFNNVRFWSTSASIPAWRNRGTAQMIGGKFTRCTFENRASSATTRGTASLVDVSVDGGNVWNNNVFEQCLFEARYLNAPAVTVTCTNGGSLWHNMWINCIGEHCAGGFVWLAGCADFTIESCPEWDTVNTDLASYTGHLFKFAAASGQTNFCSGEIRRSHRIISANSSTLGSGVYDISAFDAAPSSAARKGIRIIDCDPSRTSPATVAMNGQIEIVGKTKPFKVVTASPYTVGESDPDVIVVNSASAITVNLPASTTAQFGRRITVKNIGAGTVTIPQAVDGAAQTLTQWQKITVVTDGMNAATGRIWMSV